MKIKEAIVLAGGLGTRLRDVLPDLPKCMAPVRGLPFLTIVLDYLIEQQFTKVVLSVGYRKEQVINYFGNSYKSLTIVYASEDEPLGTGGAIKLALSYCTQQNVFVLNGDTYFIPDLLAMEEQHNQISADISIAIKQVADSGRYGSVITDDSGRIVSFREKAPDAVEGWINGGIYLLNKDVLDNISQQKFSIENDVFKVSCSSLRIQSFQTDAFFLDMGIPADYERAQQILPITAG